MKPLDFKFDTLINKLYNYVLHLGCQFLMEGFFIGGEGKLHSSYSPHEMHREQPALLHINNYSTFLEKIAPVKYTKSK